MIWNDVIGQYFCGIIGLALFYPVFWCIGKVIWALYKLYTLTPHYRMEMERRAREVWQMDLERRAKKAEELEEAIRKAKTKYSNQ